MGLSPEASSDCLMLTVEDWDFGLFGVQANKSSTIRRTNKRWVLKYMSLCLGLSLYKSVLKVVICLKKVMTIF